ncbi:MAG: tRNA 2-selenouridine(34) synthase MnmH [Oligoflexia bacterium]|nr:tRNA 2-selenouridine(34) synthase MnmH [Oligoflexia bacterium]
MSSEYLAERDWIAGLRARAPALDVRAEVEFAQGMIPGAVNLPILTTGERHEVGTCYKQRGPDAAVALGHELVGGEVKEARVARWRGFFELHPESYLYCFRGGMRSAIAQRWLAEAGIRVPRLEGGYKRARQFFLEAIERESAGQPYAVLSGYTGSGKTRLLRELARKNPGVPQLDLEGLANHRGSAFGKELDPQPAQAVFENELGRELLALPAERREKIWVEDESRMIGRITLPEAFYRALTSAPLYLIRETRESRARLLVEEYVIDSFKRRLERDPETAYPGLREGLRAPIAAISRKLGGAEASRILGMIDGAMDQAESGKGWEGHQAWIEVLLEKYYDPYYERHLERERSRIAYEGSREEVRALMGSL